MFKKNYTPKKKRVLLRSILIVMMGSVILGGLRYLHFSASKFEEKEQPDQEMQENLVENDTARKKEENKIEQEKREDKDMIDTSNYKDYFTISEIENDIYEKIAGISYPEDCPIQLTELAYLQILYVDFNGQVCKGELIVNQAIAEDVSDIFLKLYEANYKMESVKLIDEYHGDDELSMADNNSSAFNYRTISGTTTLSNHALGLAVDINPFYNPYIKMVNGSKIIAPKGSEKYENRDLDCEYYINHEDLAYQLFIEKGFTWGGDWSSAKDYQHFEKKIS